MSSVAPKLAVLALAGSALAHPNFGHGHHAKQHHHKHFFGSSGVATGTGAPYGSANATGIWGTGTGVSSHGLVASTGLATGFPHPSAVGPHTASEVAPASSSTCTDSVVRVTHTNRVTITVHQSDAAPAHTTLSTRAHSDSAVSSSSVVVSSASSAPFSSATASVSLDLDALQNKGYRNHRKTWRTSSSAAASTAAAQSTSKSSAAALSTKASTSVYVAPSSSVAAVSSSTQASSTSSSAVPQSSSTGNGKRGLAYNSASLTTCFEGNNHVTWGYNWDSQSFGLSNSFNFVPLLWGTSSDHTSQWSTVATEAIANGATHLMSFNEPDMGTQANLSPTEAAQAYKTYMMPFAGKAKLGAPAVTNGGGSMGLNWLSAFMDACTGCQIDFVSIHWYDSFQNTAYFKEHVQNATDVSGKPVWVTEFAPTDGSASDIGNFLQDVMPWMDSQSFVERYSFFMAADGKLITGTEPSSYGKIYATYNGA